MKLSSLIPVALLLALFTTNLSAQNDTYKNDVSVNVGNNIFMLLRRADFTVNDTVQFSEASGFGTPTFQIAYDRSLNKWFSLGVAYGNNAFGIKFKDLTVDGTEFGDLNFRVTRNSFNLRPLFHYGNSEKLDMYSGLRVGFSLYTAKASATLTEEQKETLGDLNKSIRGVAGVLPQVAITAFGLRGHITENFGLGFEINIGSPYMVSVGADYRF